MIGMTGRRRWSEPPFQLHEQVGRGACGIVYRGTLARAEGARRSDLAILTRADPLRVPEPKNHPAIIHAMHEIIHGMDEDVLEG